MRLITETTEPRQHADSSENDVGPHPYDLGSLPDVDLLDAWSRDRHPAALAALVQRYSVMVLSVCRRRCRTAADAEDAFQTTFLYLARNSQKIRQRERLAGWLHRVAQRAAVATQKSSKRETEPMVEPPANPEDPLDRLTQRHEAIVLDEELADLPEHYRAALVMHIYEGRPLQHLAEHFGTTIGAIRGRLQRGKQMLARRLRHRGVVPILAFAASNALTVSASQAATVSESFITTTAEGTLPDPPVDPSLLDSLLSQGVPLMPSIYTAAGLLAGTALLVLALTTAGPTNGQTAAGTETISLPPAIVGQFGGAAIANVNQASQVDASGTSGMEDASGTSGMEVASGASGMTDAGGGMAGFGGGGGGFPAPAMVWTNKPVIPSPTSEVAELANQALDAEVDLAISTTLNELPEKLSEAVGVPVLIDDRGMTFAKIAVADQKVHFEQTSVPLRTALRMMLQPLGLRAVVENEGLVITADPAALVHQGIGTAHWINIDEEAAQLIADKLHQPAKFVFVETPLHEVLDAIGSEHDLPIIVDARALEDIGMATDVPISLSIEHVKLQSALAILLSDLDLTLTIRGESLVVTTIESEESQPLQRIYWLESTGVAAGDYTSIMELITSSIYPDIWSEMGGASTIAPLGSSRPALLISTTYQVHQSIDNLFETLRETHFGVDPVMERVQVPASQNQGGFGGGMGGGGMGGGMGGGLGGGGMGGGGFF